jgi:hypothetical protein
VIYLLDEDVVLKLVAWNLFSEALALLGINESEIRIIDGFGTKLANRDDWLGQYGEAVIQRAVKLVHRLPSIGDTPLDSDELSRLGKVPKLDAGEAILFAATKTLPSFRIFTGDKKCLIALQGSTTCQDITDRIRGRVLHLEQIIFRLIEERGLKDVRDKIRPPAPQADFLITGAFGNDWNDSVDTVRTTLKTSIRKLQNECGALLNLSETEAPTGF